MFPTDTLNKVFAKYPSIKLVYFFGSRATGNEGPLSDNEHFEFQYLLKKPGLTRV